MPNQNDQDLTPRRPDEGTHQGMTLRQQTAIHSTLHSAHSNLGDAFSRQAAILVSTLGRQDAAKLVAFGAAAMPHGMKEQFRQGGRMDMAFRTRYHARYMQAQRHPSRMPVPGVQSLQPKQRVLNSMTAHVSYELERTVWGGNLICLRGATEPERDVLYVAVLKILELIVVLEEEMGKKTGHSLQQEDLVRLFATLNESTFGKGLVPWKQDINEAKDEVQRTMTVNQGPNPSEVAVCFPGCKCRERMRATEMTIREMLVADPVLPSPGVLCACCPSGIHHEATIAVIGMTVSDRGHRLRLDEAVRPYYPAQCIDQRLEEERMRQERLILQRNRMLSGESPDEELVDGNLRRRPSRAFP